MEVERRSVLHSTADQYAEVRSLLSYRNVSSSKVASVHGLRYIFEERLPSSDRILWSAAVFLCLLLSGTMVVQVVRLMKLLGKVHRKTCLDPP